MMADPEIEAEKAKRGILAVLQKNSELYGSVKVNFNKGVALNMEFNQRVFLLQPKDRKKEN